MRMGWIATMLSVVLLAAPASAHRGTVLDPDDSAGPLDVVAARLEHPGRNTLLLRVVTYEAWGDATLHGDRKFVSLEIDDRRTAGIERCVVARAYFVQEGEPTRYEGPVYEDCNAPLPYSDEVGLATVITRPDEHSVEISVGRNVLWNGRGPREFRWRALTSYEDEAWPECEPPDPMPPEHFVGTCADWTPWKTHVRPR